MNIRQIIGSAIVTAGIGALLGFGVAKIAAPEFVSQRYQELPAKYPVIGAVAGAIVGGCQCAILQLKNQRDREDSSHH
ncbi:MAG: hypothetical protein HC827_09215 [Cyanobacteria bacterium RM1_2_2]|nr:hypothetical protein [Cyanobacteria bacterium RM1_2_2]